MAWVEPKTNWSSTDYYNLEDAQRITGNLNYLKDLGESIFSFSSRNYYIFKRVNRSGEFYSALPVNTYLWTVSEYGVNRPPVNSAKEVTNLFILVRLAILWNKFKADNYSVSRIRVAVDYDQPSGVPIYYMEEYGVKLEPANTYSTAYWWEFMLERNSGLSVRRSSDSYRVTIPVEDYDDNGYSRARINTLNNLDNRPFWIAYELREFETKMKTLHDEMEQYLGG